MPCCCWARSGWPGRGSGCATSTSRSATSSCTGRLTSSASSSRPRRRPRRARAWPASSTPASTSDRAAEITAAGLLRREWSAHYLDGQTAIRHPATVRLMQDAIEVTTASGWMRLWPYRDIRQTQGFYQGEEVRLERAGELAEAVVVSDPAFLHSLREAAPATAGFHDPAGRGRRVRLTVMAGVAIVGITAALYLWGIPLLAALA